VNPVQLSDGTFRLVPYDYRIDSASTMSMGPGKADLELFTVTRAAPNEAPVQLVYAAYPPVESPGAGWPVVWTGRDGVQGIVSASGANGVITVVVQTSAGEQTWKYVTTNDQTWTRQR
jgi:hypothetical protein